MKTYDEPVTFCHRCGMFNDEAKNVKQNNVMDATISTSARQTKKNIQHAPLTHVGQDLLYRMQPSYHPTYTAHVTLDGFLLN